MNLREAAQQALEAMEVWKDSLFDENALPGWRFSVLGEKAITDLRAALADSTRQESRQVEPFGYFQYSMHLDAWVQNKECNKGIAFYTAPPKRKPLTDEEIQRCIYEVDDARLAGPITKFARSIERAHGIGGEK